MVPSLSAHVPYLWLVAASLIAGAMNAMAAGGSFISFPAMIAIGVPPIQANATNTVALWPGQLTSIWALRTDLRRDLLAVVVSSAILGGIGGAVVLLNTRPRTFMHLVPWLLLIASLLFWISGPISRWLRRRSDTPHAARTPAMLPLFFALLVVNFYIGYFGAGAGFLAMSVLALFGVEEISAVNSLKILGACLANFCAVVTFIFGGAIVWHYCLVSMLAAGIGGYAGAHYSRRMDPGVLRGTVVVIGCTMAAYFFLETVVMPHRTTAIEAVGYLAAFCTTVAFVPQLVRIVRLRSAREISLPTFLVYSIGIFFWLLYGIYTGSGPIIASNIVTLGISVSILVLKLRYDRPRLKELEP